MELHARGVLEASTVLSGHMHMNTYSKRQRPYDKFLSGLTGLLSRLLEPMNATEFSLARAKTPLLEASQHLREDKGILSQPAYTPCKDPPPTHDLG